MASAEYDQDANATQARPKHSVLSKKVKITFQGNGETEDSFYTSPPPPPPPPRKSPPTTNKQPKEADGLAKQPVGNDAESWVTRIMHPWVDSPLCCPDQFDIPRSPNTSMSMTTGSLLDQAEESTIGSGSVGSSTPILPPFPTSTDEIQTNVEEKEEEDPPRRAVLGIKTRRVDPDDALVVEELVDRKKRTRGRSLSPYSYGREDTRQRSPSAWRKKAWTRFESKRKSNGATVETLHGIVEDDFDIESFSEFGQHGDPSSRLAEI